MRPNVHRASSAHALLRSWPRASGRSAGRLLGLSLMISIRLHGAAGENWPMFRGGPALLGAAPGNLAKNLSLLWSFKTQGPVKSSAAVVDGRVFIGSEDQNAYALELATGKKIWSFKTDGAVESSPLVLRGKVYFGSSDGWLYALEGASGKLVWKYQTSDKILGSPNWVKSPRGDTTWILVGSYDYKLHCLDGANGRTNWIYETGN